jgi:energy-coupling factor transporter ATP-binding protein EcfA2
MADAAIRVEGLTKRIGNVAALDGIDFEVPAGSVFGLLGPNGAGKTTAVRVLATILRPDGGGEFALLIKPDGSLWSWGYNLHGQLGVGDLTLRPVAWRVGTTNDWATVACGDYHPLAIKTDGTLWAWGLNASEELGLGDTTDRTSPVQVGTTGGWATMACGDAYSMAIKTDGSLWTAATTRTASSARATRRRARC